MALVSRACMRTDLGVVRVRNEDTAYVDELGRFVIVADGMGGHGAGDVASAMAVELLRASLEAEAPLLAAYTAAPSPEGRDLLAAQLGRAVERANTEVYDRSVRELDKHQMGSTLEVVVVCDAEAFIAHVGDSRTYLVRDGELKQLTHDHTVAEVMRRAGTIGEHTAITSPMRSVLSNAIGVTPTVEVELLRVDLRLGDRLLVCSDGLHEYFTRDELALHLAGGDADAALTRMIEHARAGGGHDNITGVVIDLRPRPSATITDDLFEDGPTNPISLPEPSAVPVALGGVSDDTLANFIERSLHEQSRPIAAGKNRS
ncbi:MAG: serine/threonine-protein phosphatase [Myxococcales bacterium]|nr:serine/threonine-protein phosphatase [Myxococcales bacterium]